MEPISLTAVAAFLGACLYKAGEKFSEKTIEAVFNNGKELAASFTGLLRNDIITLGLSDAKTSAEIQGRPEEPETVTQALKTLNDNPSLIFELIKEKPQVADQALLKLKDNPKLMTELNERLTESGERTINVEKIGQYIETNHGIVTQHITM